MPTRIALKKTLPTSEPRMRSNPLSGGFLMEATGINNNNDDNDNIPVNTSLRSNDNTSNTNNNNNARHRRELPAFRSSILRELSVRNHFIDNNNNDVDTIERVVVHDDIRASPRLLGYVFSMIAGAIMLVSVVEFYRQRIPIPEVLSSTTIETDFDVDIFYYFYGGAVLQWKLWGAIYASSAGVFFCLFTVLVHYDTKILPKLWLSIFHDGSLSERNWIFFLILFWGGAVHVCTSTLSVGESQANVFFTTWIAFAAASSNYGVWRESAGLSPLALESKRETTYNWMWITFFSAVFAGATTDMYYNRNDITLRYQGEPLELGHRDWIIILSVIWSEVAVCIIAIFLNETFENSFTFPCCIINRREHRYRCVFGWRQLEGFVILTATGCKFWVILRYADVDGVIPGLSNAYFGVWGSFFNGVFALGSWLKENKNIEYVIRDDTSISSSSRSRPNKKRKKAKSKRGRSKTKKKKNSKQQARSRSRSADSAEVQL